MNDPFEEQLRTLRPAALPPELRARLPEPTPTKTVRPRRPAFVAWGTLVAAACLALAFLLRTPALPAVSPVLVGSQSSQVTGVRPVSTFTDGENHPWQLLEVSWVEQSTLVSASGPLAMEVRDTYRALVPAAIYFD